MKARVLILFALLCAAMAPAATTDTIHSTGDSCSIIVDSTGKQIGKTCKTASIFRRSEVYQALTYGVAIPAIQINAKTGGIGFLAALDPATVTLNGLQYIWVRSSEVHRMALWTVSLGLSVSKTDSGGFTLGATAVPWGVRVDDVVLGLGVRWTASEVVHLRRKDFSIVIPITYSL